MDRIYHKMVASHFESWRKMAFITGPRQAGKTTVAESFWRSNRQSVYWNWDVLEDRQEILKQSLPDVLLSKELGVSRPLLVLDEVHKYGKWKDLLKGLFDKHRADVDFLVTGSARLDFFKKSGDSLLGRYFSYRLHPLSVGEFMSKRSVLSEHFCEAQKACVERTQALLEYGGFPEPCLAENKRMHRRWLSQRRDLLFQEDMREVAKVNEMAQMELLGHLLLHQAGQCLSYTGLSKQVRVSVDTIRRWLDIVEALFYCYRVRPFYKNIARSLRKEPKVYLWDWSEVEEEGARLENMVASHLLKACHFWTDQGMGDYDLQYIRTFEKEEVDFVVVKNKQPWMLVEVKSSRKNLSPAMLKFHQQLPTEFALQVTADMDFVPANCFADGEPKRVPLSTFLGQLV